MKKKKDGSWQTFCNDSVYSPNRKYKDRLVTRGASIRGWGDFEAQMGCGGRLI